MNELELRFMSGGYNLTGTFLFPPGVSPVPGVLLVPGSGPVDRDENAPGLPFNVTGELAVRLTAGGMATFRYDKRGVGASEGSFMRTGFLDNAVDAEQALEALAGRPEVDSMRLFVVGHSEGAFIAVRMASAGRALAGLVLLSGAARSGEETLRWQSRRVVENITGLNRWIIRIFRLDIAKRQRREISRIKASGEDVLKVGWFKKINARWYREFMAFDPAECLPAIDVPLLAITGDKDVQVNPDDLDTMARLCPGKVETHRLINVNHILRREEGRASITHYRRQVREPIVGEVVETVLEWLRRQVGDRNADATGS
jgi:hypothetical protein